MAIGRSIGGLLGICIGCYMFAATIPGAISALNEANTTGWTAAQAAIWPIVGIVMLFASIGAILGDQF